MAYIVTGYIHKRDKTYDGTGSRQRMIHEVWPDEPAANRRAKDLVETGPCLWAKYERRSE